MTPSDAAARQIRPDASAPGATPETAAVTVPPFATIYEQYFDFVWRSARRLGVTPAAMDRLGAVVGQNLPRQRGQRTAGFVHQKVGGRKVPVVAVSPGKSDVECALRDACKT